MGNSIDDLFFFFNSGAAKLALAAKEMEEVNVYNDEDNCGDGDDVDALDAERVLQQETRDAVVVAFTTARCPHCAALKPHWEALRDEFAVRKRTVDVLEIDCGEAREVCAWQRATRFPTIKYYVPGDGDELGREYGTSRAATYDALATFVEH